MSITPSQPLSGSRMPGTISGLRRWQPVVARPGQGAFTLLEVLLAILIVVGLLMVALYFYQQAASLRTELVLQTEAVSTARLLMDRMTAELRTACAHDELLGGMMGTSNSIEFVTAGIPSFAYWSGEEEGPPAPPRFDLSLVSYRLAGGAEWTNVIGVERSERPLLQPGPASTSEDQTTGEEDLGLPPEEEAVVTAEPAAEAAPAPVAPNLVASQLRFMRFRYWDGSDWAESWDGFSLPAGVEISLGVEPLPAELAPDEYPGELFRRVIYLPGSESVGGTDWIGMLGGMLDEELAPEGEDESGVFGEEMLLP